MLGTVKDTEKPREDTYIEVNLSWAPTFKPDARSFASIISLDFRGLSYKVKKNKLL